MLSVAMLSLATTPKSAHLGLITPQSLEGNVFGDVKWKQVSCAAMLAVKHVTQGNETIVPGLKALTSNLTNFTGGLYDTGYRPSPAIVSYRQMKADGAMAIVGAARSAVSKPLAQLAAIDKMPQCSYWSTSPSLSDESLYPYCARHRPPAVGTLATTGFPSHQPCR